MLRNSTERTERDGVNSEGRGRLERLRNALLERDVGLAPTGLPHGAQHEVFAGIPG